MKHLWEVDHPYYCASGNFYAPRRDCFERYESWASFFAEEGDADLDQNLVFRFDWLKEDPATEKGVLSLFIVGQSKALLRSVEIDVTDADEPAVIAYLTPRLELLARLWAPLPYPHAGN